MLASGRVVNQIVLDLTRQDARAPGRREHSERAGRVRHRDRCTRTGLVTEDQQLRERLRAGGRPGTLPGRGGDRARPGPEGWEARRLPAGEERFARTDSTSLRRGQPGGVPAYGDDGRPLLDEAAGCG